LHTGNIFYLFFQQLISYLPDREAF
jgi:hypothetical protein